MTRAEQVADEEEEENANLHQGLHSFHQSRMHRGALEGELRSMEPSLERRLTLERAHLLHQEPVRPLPVRILIRKQLGT